MNAEQIDLARQIDGLPGFAMHPGMRDHDGVRVIRLVRGRKHYADGVNEDADPETPNDGWVEFFADEVDPDGIVSMPDLTDAATGGVLLGWLAEMGLGLNVSVREMRWSVSIMLGRAHSHYDGGTLAEACARALVAIGRCA